MIPHSIDIIRGKIGRLGLTRQTTTRWPDERVALLTGLASDSGLSLREIGRRMTERLGIPHTKDMVRWKLHELGIERPVKQRAERAPAPGPTSQPQVKDLSPPKDRWAPGYLSALKAPPDPCRAIHHRSCQYPLGEPGGADFRLCSDPVMLGKPYCEEHQRLCFIRLQREQWREEIPQLCG